MGRGYWALGFLALTATSVGCEQDEFTAVSGELGVPEVIDFGDVQVGMTAKLDATFSNSGRARVTIKSFSGDSLAGSRRQFILPTVQEGININAGREEFATFKFQPFEAAAEPYEVSIQVEIAGEVPQVLILRGRGVASGLEVTPNPLDFQTVLAGASRTLDLTITNRLAVPVTLRSLIHQGTTPEARQTSGSGQFTIDIEVDAQGLLNGGMPLAAGASIVVPVTYAPDPTAPEGGDRARWAISNCDFELCTVQVDLRGKGTTAALACIPQALDFGAVNPGRTRNLSLECTNIAADEITVDGWAFESSTASEYSLGTVSRSQVIAAGAAITIDVAFSPSQATYDMGFMAQGSLLVSNSHSIGGQLNPVRVELNGRAGGPTLVVTPVALHFGEVAVGTHNDKVFLVENRGLEPLIVSMVDADRDNTGMFAVDALPFSLNVGTSSVVTVRFAPTATGTVASAVRLTTNDSLAQTFDVTVDGSGLTLPPCSYRTTPTRLNFGAIIFGQTAVLGTRIENLGQDDCLINDVEILPRTFGSTTAYTLVNGNQTGVLLAPGASLDVPVEYVPVSPGGDGADLGFYISDPMNPNPRVPLYGVGEPLVQVECPPPIVTQAGVPVTLTANGIASGATITGYAWALTSFPIGGQGTPNQWSPNPPTAITETFLPYIVGTYDIQVTMTDNVGRMAFCTTQVIAEGEGLQVTMTWDGAGDVDLHLHNGNTSSPWFTSDDCSYTDRTPAWDAAFPAATGPNPELDFDNTSSNGPENTRVLVPIVGHTYTIAAHNYSGATGRRVTVDIFCGGTLPQATYISRPLAGTGFGNCSSSDFWRVAQVTFTSQNTCTVIPVDTYGPSSAACAAF